LRLSAAVSIVAKYPSFTPPIKSFTLDATSSAADEWDVSTTKSMAKAVRRSMVVGVSLEQVQSSWISGSDPRDTYAM
jgi:hypothetical protein